MPTRLILWTVIFPLVVVTAFGVAVSFQYLFLSSILTAILLLGWIIKTVISIVHLMLIKQRHQAIILMTLFLLTFPAMCCAYLARDYLHLFIMYPEYRKEIIAHNKSSSGPIWFSWGSFDGSAVTQQVSTFIVYDKSDAIAHQVGNDPEPECSSDCWTTIRSHLIGHFYKVNKVYP